MPLIIKCGECENVYESPDSADVLQCPECGHVVGSGFWAQNRI